MQSSSACITLFYLLSRALGYGRVRWRLHALLKHSETGTIGMYQEAGLLHGCSQVLPVQYHALSRAFARPVENSSSVYCHSNFGDLFRLAENIGTRVLPTKQARFV